MEDLPLGRIAALLPEFAVKDLSLGRTVMMMMMMMMQLHSARSHAPRSIMRKIQELGGIELLPHLVHGLDLTPSDYQLFQSMAHFLRGRNV